MWQILSNNPLLTVFLVVALGAMLGAIPFGKIKLGAAGALFIGLFLSAHSPDLGNGMVLLQGLGLALFVYTVGINAGQGFMSEVRRQSNLFLAIMVIIVVGAVGTGLAGSLLKLPVGLKTGIFTGALTAAPALDAATRLTGSSTAAVGYAFGYPLAVIIGIVIVSIVARLPWTGSKDTPALAGMGLTPVTVRVKQATLLRKLPGYLEGKIRCSYLFRDNKMRVVSPAEELLAGDEVVLVGFTDSVQKAADQLGEIQSHHLADDRSDVVFEPIVVSNPELYGASIAELNLSVRFGAVATRVHRGDLDLLARDDFRLEPADSVSVVAPREELSEVRKFFGDSVRKVSEVDALSLGFGLVLGILLGLVSIPMPNGSFSLGPAAGPLLVGMILGALRRTGPIVWTMPQAANLTIRQLGLLLFMAGLGLTAGPEFAKLALSPVGLRTGILAIGVVSVCCLAVVLAGRLLGLSAPRTAGAVAGFLGQPAVLAAANRQVADERIEAAYASLFAFSIIVKILLVPLVVSL